MTKRTTTIIATATTMIPPTTDQRKIPMVTCTVNVWVWTCGVGEESVTVSVIVYVPGQE